jgi:transposase
VPEVRRLLLALAEPPGRFAFRLRWSRFRRRHQAVAKRCHAARRARGQPAPGDAPPIQVGRAGEFVLTDATWARVAPLLPPQHPATGRPNHDHRTVLAGILWVARTGSAWRDLPAQFGPWQTVHSRYTRWRKAGVWPRILDALAQAADTQDAQLSL